MEAFGYYILVHFIVEVRVVAGVHYLWKREINSDETCPFGFSRSTLWLSIKCVG